MAKEKGKSMAAMQQGRKGEYGQASSRSTGETSGIDSKWHERPEGPAQGCEYSTVVNDGDGMCK